MAAKASVTKNLTTRLRAAMGSSLSASVPKPKLAVDSVQPKHEPVNTSVHPKREPVSQPIACTDSLSVDAIFNQIEQTELIPESTTTTKYTYLIPAGAPSQPTPKPNPRRAPPQPPSYKHMPHTSFTVDAFKYGVIDNCTGYFLTHFHSDHYGGLTRGFQGHIYCSRITANLVVHKLKVDQTQVHALPMNTRCLVHGVYVTMVDAEHCPGAVLFLFEVPGEKVVRIVHTGDFRASDRHIKQIARVFATDLTEPVTPEMLSNIDDMKLDTRPTVDYVYLDTTYLDPSYTFPQQQAVITAIGEFCHRINSKSEYLLDFLAAKKSVSKPTHDKRSAVSRITSWFQPLKLSMPRRTTLYVVGTYIIGKEKILVEIAQRLNSKIYVTPAKRALLDCLGSPQLSEMLVADPKLAQVHAVSMNVVNMKGVTEYLQANPGFSRIIAFRPTGWTHTGAFMPGRRQTTAVSTIRPEAVPDSAIAETRSKQKAQQLFAKAARIDHDAGFGIEENFAPHGSSDKATVFPVPYSEHSSFAELARFVCSLDVTHVVPTMVSSDPTKNHVIDEWLTYWSALKHQFAAKDVL
ncbi:repair protein PSO2 SNM1 [Linderina macrospora]|uniref:Repair protein PSO2 SNM1 n=1 Tax=Linderina macrospora TaxID=4868 RepID=A0ACC1JFY7_9FUNG|nr:repair protein PSO2 SNM1 [Linderina macrospora]